MAETAQPELLRSFTDTRVRSKAFKELHSQAIVDGSKIILRLGKKDRISFDHPIRILFATPKIVTTRDLFRSAKTIICEDSYNLIVLDTGVVGDRFFPISLSHYGTVYTHSLASHVVLGNHRRHKVAARSLPYRTCNKFENAAGDPPPTTEDECAISQQAETSDGILYLRGNESLTRYRLCKGERIELHAGTLVAWTLGVHFEFRYYCCMRYVSGVSGEGTVWIQSKTRVHLDTY